MDRSIKAGMIPVIPIEFARLPELRPSAGTACRPTPGRSANTRGASSPRPKKSSPATRPRRSCSRRSTSPGATASPQQYAAFLALLLPPWRSSHLPLEDVYVGASGRAGCGRSTQAQPQLRTEIQGWYLHPYARERKPGQGIAELPRIRAEMASGQNNLIVSEIGFCVRHHPARAVPDLRGAGATSTKPRARSKPNFGSPRRPPRGLAAGAARLLAQRRRLGDAAAEGAGSPSAGLMLESFADRYG